MVHDCACVSLITSNAADSRRAKKNCIAEDAQVSRLIGVGGGERVCGFDGALPDRAAAECPRCNSTPH